MRDLLIALAIGVVIFMVALIAQIQLPWLLIAPIGITVVYFIAQTVRRSRRERQT